MHLHCPRLRSSNMSAVFERSISTLPHSHLRSYVFSTMWTSTTRFYCDHVIQPRHVGHDYIQTIRYIRTLSQPITPPQHGNAPWDRLRSSTALDRNQLHLDTKYSDYVLAAVSGSGLRLPTTGNTALSSVYVVFYTFVRLNPSPLPRSCGSFWRLDFPSGDIR